MSLERTSEWAPQQVDLSAYDGKDVRLRFRVETNNAINSDGLMLDNLMVIGEQ